MPSIINSEKILTKETLKTFKNHSGKGQVIGLCHGVFDVIHHGHLEHFASARNQCDFLIVSLTCDKYVNKSASGPFHSELKRLQMVAALEIVDAVYVNYKKTSDEVLRLLQPHKYFKGIDYVEQLETNPDLQAEKTTCEEFGGELVFTSTTKLSSTYLINNYLDPKRKEVAQFIRDNNITLTNEEIGNVFKRIGSVAVDLFGETIEDKYCFGKLTGISSKFTAPSFLVTSETSMLGGVAALVPLLEIFGCKSNVVMPKRLKRSGFERLNSVTLNYNNIVEVQKRRFISERNKERLFEDVKVLAGEKTAQKKTLDLIYKSQANCILAYDFGHGFFDGVNHQEIKEIPFFAVNVQSNSTNYPFNDCSKYPDYSALTLDERELRLTLREDKAEIEELIKLFLRRFVRAEPRYHFFTFGEKGAAAHFNGQLVFCPATVSAAIDATGSGDVFHLIASVMAYCEFTLPIILLYANAFAGYYAQIEGHHGEWDLEAIQNSIKALA